VNGGNLQTSVNGTSSVFSALLPYIEQGAIFNYIQANPSALRPGVKTYLSPADPTLPGDAVSSQLASYATNGVVFRGDPSLSNTFQDGTSNTIAFVERYAICQGSYFFTVTMSRSRQSRGAPRSRMGSLTSPHSHPGRRRRPWVSPRSRI
jgi:hypothetical protein